MREKQTRPEDLAPVHPDARSDCFNFDCLNDDAARLLLILLRQILDTVTRLDGRLAVEQKAFFTVAEFASLVGRSSYTVRRWIAEQRLNGMRVADSGPKGRWLIARQELDRVIESGSGGNIPPRLAG